MLSVLYYDVECYYYCHIIMHHLRLPNEAGSCVHDCLLHIGACALRARVCGRAGVDVCVDVCVHTYLRTDVRRACACVARERVCE